MLKVETPRRWYLPSILAFIAIAFSSCFSRYFMTDQEIEAHYQARSVKPAFRFAEAEGKKLHYAEVGCDTMPLVLFIHGAPGAWYGYMNYLEDTTLLKHARMISVDRPGYGKSGYGKSVVSIEEQARRIYPLIKSCEGKRPVVVVGRSYGGPIAARLAMDHPEAVSALILLAPAVDPKHEKFWWFSKPGRSRIIRWLLPKAFNVATDEKFAHVDELQKMTDRWKSLDMPVTIMHGSADNIVDTANYYFLRKCLDRPQHSFVYLEGQSHFIAAERPDLVRAAILRHLEALKKKQ